MDSVKTSVTAQSQALSTAADQILSQPPIPQRRFQPLSAAEAVLRYWSDFIPSWAGAISIDLLPVVLVLVLMVVNDAMRRDTGELDEAESISAAEMLRAMALFRQMAAAAPSEPMAPAVPLAPETPAPPIEQPIAPATPVAVGDGGDATITPIDLNQRKRSDGPLRP
jgi:hypothetical protein